MRPVVSARTLAEIKAFVLGSIADDLAMAFEAQQALDGEQWDWQPHARLCLIAGGAVATPSSTLASFLVLHASPAVVRDAALRDRELILMIDRELIVGEAMLRVLHGLLSKYGENIEGFDPSWRSKIEMVLHGAVITVR
ncbi:hypothetical protein [Arthrobacter crystallopoietes]|uniref:Uncharacterized protein n=1 Tax=Crystallibacter crystallopoietes TaxID=37928 RepID=A0A1H1BDZ5_9MICC|nr:hypothetical protein [Arthrobacter crystallopoietes]AUI51180.1 hypothetical protein AC20117_10570 [Arthrobacter crystallopoietes]SDQ50020.1 hypothetical protein SAMN04489742_1359 [Arthrobacter crystallopoietes]